MGDSGKPRDQQARGFFSSHGGEARKPTPYLDRGTRPDLLEVWRNK